MIKINNIEYKPEYFPSGALRMTGLERFFLENSYYPDMGIGFKYDLSIEWKFENNEELISLIFLVNHIRSLDSNVKIFLSMPYVPNAQMDRTGSYGEVFTLKYFCDLINNLKFDKVFVCDVHSDVTLALIDRVHHNTAAYFIEKAVDKINSDLPLIFFYPDNGAAKKYSKYFEGYYLYAVKNRDWNTGEILGLEVIGEVPTTPFNVLFIDDIIAYGGTCYHSAKKLKELGANKIYAYISHVENSILDEEKGLLIKSDLLEKIYCLNSIFTKEHPLIKKV